MKSKYLIIAVALIAGLCVSVFAQTNVPRGWMDGGGESIIYPAAVDNGYIGKQVAIGTNVVVPGMEFTVKGTATITNKLAVGTTTISTTSTLNVVGTVSATGFSGDGSGLTNVGGAGDMTAATYDPQTIAGDAFNLAVHTGSIAGVAPPYIAQNNGTGTLSAATIAGIAAPYIAQNSGTGTLSAATIAGIAAPYIAQNSGTGTTITLAGTSTFPSGVWGNTGKVGIGTTTPTTTLHVDGTVTATGFVGDGSQLTGISGGSVAFSGVTGSATASQLPLISGLLGSATYAQLPTVIRLTGTTTSPEAGAFGQLYVQSSSSGGNDDEYTKLLLHMDNPGASTFVDSSLSAHTVTANGNAIGTTTAKFGSGAGYFDGTGDYLSISNTADLNLSSGTWTIEYWGKRSNVGTTCVYFAKGTNNTDANQSYSLRHDTASNVLRFVSNSSIVAFSDASLTTNWQHYAIVYLAGSVYLYIDGTQISSGAITIVEKDAPLNIGQYEGVSNTYDYEGYIDEFRLSKGIARWTSNFDPPTAPYSINHTQYSTKYDDPVNGNTVFEILTPGTATTIASYIYNNATTTVWGLGTNTAVTGTTSGAYAGWTNRPIRVSAVDIASTKKIKENIMPIRIKPEQLEAESKAKPIYIAEKKPTWFADNEMNYTYVGSDTATYVDTAAMESDYTDYIELEWASDLNQSVYIEAVQKAQQKYFWGLFDEIQPKSWNPIDDLRMTRKGLIVEEVPDQIKGADGQSIDQMAVVTYQTLVLQELKDSVVDIMQALRGLAATGTFTTQAIDDRLEVMRISN